MHDETHLFRKMKVNSAFDRYSFSMIQFFISQGHCEFDSFMLISAYDNRFDNITRSSDHDTKTGIYEYDNQFSFIFENKNHINQDIEFTTTTL